MHTHTRTNLTHINCKFVLFRGYDLATLVGYLNQVYLAKSIDDLLVQLVSSTSNCISKIICHAIVYYYFMFSN